MNDYRLIRYRFRIPDEAIYRDDDGVLATAVEAFVALCRCVKTYRTQGDKVFHLEGEAIEPDRPSKYQGHRRAGAAAAAIGRAVDDLAPWWRESQSYRQ